MSGQLATMPAPPMSEPSAPAVYRAIANVSLDISKEGIAKDRKNDQQGYTFRGIDDVYNALAPMLAKHGLVILPRMLARIVTERTTKSGSLLFSVVVEAEFDFVAASDGSKHIVRTFGEAMDSADKATNKAMSAAYKYAAFQTFCIPTEGDNDADRTTHTDVLPVVPTGYDDWLIDMKAVAESDGMAGLRKAFMASKPENREYATKQDAAKWAAVKAVADATDKAGKVAK